MKNSLLAFLVLGGLAFSCNRTSDKLTAVSIGRIDSLYSNLLKEQRKIWVYVPNEGSQTAYSQQRYPVLYLLDGPAHFHAVTGLLRHLVENSLCPEMIVVAIPNTDRSRDLTPTHSLGGTDGKPQDFLKTTGGGEVFTSFLEKELIPYVEAHYPTAPHRMLVGHSFGGLFAINALINHPRLFNSYVAIDPSMWWDNRKLLSHADTVLAKAPFDKKTLFLSIANTMEKGMDTARLVTDTTGNTEHIRSIFQFRKEVKANAANGLRFGWKYYAADDHGSVPLISEYDAFRFIFDYYKPDIDYETVTVDVLAHHFKTVSDRIGYALPPPEAVVNQVGYSYMRQKKFDQAFSFFNLNVENYPKSQNVFDSMGDFYVAKGDTAKAIETYTKALTLGETPYTRKKLEELNEKRK